jgi:hypothetical protein
MIMLGDGIGCGSGCARVFHLAPERPQRPLRKCTVGWTDVRGGSYVEPNGPPRSGLVFQVVEGEYGSALGEDRAHQTGSIRCGRGIEVSESGAKAASSRPRLP